MPTVLVSCEISTCVRIRVRWGHEAIALFSWEVSTCVRVWVRRDKWAASNHFN
jgi:hypothetical protein